MAPKHYARHQHLVPRDVISELRRARARVGNKFDGMKLVRRLEKKDSIDEVYKNMLLSLLTMDDRPDPRKKKYDANNVVEQKTRPVALKNRKRKCNVIDQRNGRSKARISEKNKALVPLDNDRFHKKTIKENNWLMQYQSDHVAQAQPVKIYSAPIGGKLKGVVKEEYEANKKIVVKKEKEKIYQDCGSRKNRVTRNYHQDVGQVQLGKKHAVRGQTKLIKVERGDNGLSSKKTAFGDRAVKEEPDHCVETHLPLKGIHRQIGKVKCTNKCSIACNSDEKYLDCVETRPPVKGVHSQIEKAKRAKCSIAYNSDGKYMEGEGSSKTAPEVIILDSDMVVKKEIFSPFVSSKKYHISMVDDGSENFGLPSENDNEFRRELLKVLRKPYDREEHQKSREAIRAGSYLDYHPDVQRKLTKYRYKREKYLIILRGFLFWLQNLTREGAFEPWKDKQCLALELPSR